MMPLECFRDAIARDATIFLAGCGGFAAHAQHMAAELVVRYRATRRPYRAIALGCNAAIWTAAENDLGPGYGLSRELAALGRPGDLVAIYSTSGKSPMLLKLAWTAYTSNLTVLAYAPAGSPLAQMSAHHAPVHDQEAVLTHDHALCAALDAI